MLPPAFVVIFLQLLSSSWSLDCTINNHTTTDNSQQTVTVRFSLPDACVQSRRVDITVAVKRPDAAPDVLCQMTSQGGETPKKLTSDCQFDSQTKEYLVPRMFGETEREEEVQIKAEVSDRQPISTVVSLKIPARIITTPPPATTTTNRITTTPTASSAVDVDNAVTRDGVTAEDKVRGGEGERGEGGGGGGGALDKTERQSESTSFTQTPAFGIIIIAVVVCMALLLVVVLVKQRGISCRKRGRRHSVEVPENYDHPAGRGIALAARSDDAHDNYSYERPARRGTLPAPPVASSAPDNYLHPVAPRATEGSSQPGGPTTSAKPAAARRPGDYDVPASSGERKQPQQEPGKAQASRAISCQVNRDSLLDPNYEVIAEVMQRP